VTTCHPGSVLSVNEVLARCWPVALCPGPVVLRPVSEQDGAVLAALMTDPQVRRYLGGPASEERVARGRREYPGKPGCWAVQPADSDEAVGLVTIGADHRVQGRAEVSYQLLPSVWGKGLGKQAVGVAVDWWNKAAVDGGPLIAVTQRANIASRRLLESLTMVLLDDRMEEYGELQCLYGRVDSQDDVLRWARLYDVRREEAERRLGEQLRATEEGTALPGDLSDLGLDQLARRCPARHGAHGRICARDVGHRPQLHLGRAGEGGWVAWKGDAEH